MLFDFFGSFFWKTVCGLRTSTPLADSSFCREFCFEAPVPTMIGLYAPSLRWMALTSQHEVCMAWGSAAAPWNRLRPAFLKNLNSFKWILKILAARDPSTKLWTHRGYTHYLHPHHAGFHLPGSVNGPRDMRRKLHFCLDFTVFDWNTKLRSPLQGWGAVLHDRRACSWDGKPSFKTRYHILFPKAKRLFYWCPQG